MNKEKVWKIINTILMCFMFMLVGFGLGIKFGNIQPTIEFKKGVLDYDEGIGLIQFGRYYPHRNSMVVSLSSDDVENTILHEYGHYIYEVMDKKDRDYWDNELCNKSKKIFSYKESQLCNEWFAIQFASYLQGNYNIPEREFMNKVYAHYLR